MENDTTAPAEVEQPVIEQPAEQPVETPEETPAEVRRRLRILASEIDLPETLDEDTYKRLEEISGQINKGVDQKFKEAAEARKQAALEREQAQQWRSAQEELLTKAQEAAALRWQTKQYEDVDWYAQVSNAPDDETRQRIRDLRDFVQSTNAKADKLENEYKTAKAAETQEQQGLVAHFQQVGEQVLKQQIKDWGPEKQKLVLDTMKQYGVGQTHPMLDQAAMVAANFHPAIIKAFHDAALYQRSLKKAEQDSKAETPAPRPVSRVGGNAASAKDPDRMSTEEWLRWRNAQVRGKAA